MALMQAIAARRSGLARRLAEANARRVVERRWRQHLRSGVHEDRQDDIIVSLTSYPKRYATLSLTLKSLLAQSLAPGKVILWIAHGDMDALPMDVRALEQHGLTIAACEDYRSFKKFIPALAQYPDHRIAICDDDTWYWPDWLAALATPLPADQIACHRVHRIRLDAEGRPLSYGDWEQQSDTRLPSPLNYATGVGGMMLHAARLDPRILDIASANRLCPSADDMWIYYMGRLAGSTFMRVGDNDPTINWRDSQDSALWRTNNVGDVGNDRQFAAMVAEFGDAIFSPRADVPAATG